MLATAEINTNNPYTFNNSKNIILSDPKGLINGVIDESGSTYASDGDAEFQGAIFGRDSLLTAQFLLDTLPDLKDDHDKEFVKNVAHDTIKFLAENQGMFDNKLTEEEFGKIPHETRLWKNAKTEASKNSFKHLKEAWGGNDERVVSYMGADQTARFVNLLINYCGKFGNDILDETIARKSVNPITNWKVEHTITIRESLIDANTWINNKINNSRIKLLEYKKINPSGIDNQHLRDSLGSIYNDKGEIPDFKKPVATIELQGLAYDALRNSIKLLKDDKSYLGLTKTWEKTAKKLHENTIRHFWNKKSHEYPVVAIARNRWGNLIKVETITSNALELLDTTFFDEMDEDEKIKYLKPMVEKCFDAQFLTDVGIRCVSTKYLNEPGGYSGYHGPLKSWPVLTNIIRRGLDRQGFHGLGYELNTRLINGINISGVFPEFFDVLMDGTVGYFATKHADGENEDDVDVVSTNGRIMFQTWTGAALWETRKRQSKKYKLITDPNTKNYGVEKDILNQINRAEPIKTLDELDKIRRKNRVLVVNSKKGLEMEAEFRKAVASGKHVILN